MSMFSGKRLNSAEAAAYCGFRSKRSFVERVKSRALKIAYYQNGKRGHLVFVQADLDDYLAGRRHGFGMRGVA